MELGFLGLGKMGMNMVKRLRKGGHSIVAYDKKNELKQLAEAEGCKVIDSLDDLISNLSSPRAVWVMVPAGQATESVITSLSSILQKGDVIIDGGNTKYKDDKRRALDLCSKGLHYIDVGTSGGIWGLQVGYCLMVGGDQQTVEYLAPLFETLAPPNGWAHVGNVGAGHYVKMIHNAIEYSLMQGYAEGFELMSRSDYNLDLNQIASVWQHGSVIRSWLLELTADILKENPSLNDVLGRVEDSGEGRWTLEDALEKDVPVGALSTSIFTRFRSRQTNPFSEKLLNAMRHAFGGHSLH